VLIESGTNTQIKNNEGNTVLDIAGSSDDKTILNFIEQIINKKKSPPVQKEGIMKSNAGLPHIHE